VIKGATILAVGFGLGYAKCLSDQEEVRVAAVTFKNFVEDEWQHIRAEREAKNTEATPTEAEVIEPNDETPQGETP
jgi:hypothetical protein